MKSKAGKILDYINSGESIGPNKAASLANTTPEHAAKMLAMMAQQGLIKRSTVAEIYRAK
jgi:predicted transcriptional regulator